MSEQGMEQRSPDGAWINTSGMDPERRRLALGLGPIQYMSIASFGRVLATMAEYSRDRAYDRRQYMNVDASELLYALSHIFKAGAEKCLEIAKEKSE